MPNRFLSMTFTSERGSAVLDNSYSYTTLAVQAGRILNFNGMLFSKIFHNPCQSRILNYYKQNFIRYLVKHTQND